MRRKNNTSAIFFIILGVAALLYWAYKYFSKKQPKKPAEILIGDPVGSNISDEELKKYQTPGIIDPVKAAVISENPLTTSVRDIVEQTVATGGFKPTPNKDLGMLPEGTGLSRKS